MKQLFISAAPDLLPSWREAFDDDAMLLPPVVKSGLNSSVLYWVDWHSMTAERADEVLKALLASYAKVVVMSARPSGEEGMGYFTAGAVGYCHQRAAANQLREIALVIEHGGVWLGAEAMQRMLRGTLRWFAPAKPSGAVANLLQNLTAKERAVADEVAHGASNREIADTLAMSERTVKSHLSSIFDKLSVRDRVQLALLLNNVPLR